MEKYIEFILFGEGRDGLQIANQHEHRKGYMGPAEGESIVKEMDQMKVS